MIAEGLVHQFVASFVSRRDDYAIQQSSGRYVRANRPVTFSTLRAHLEGTQTIGTYVMDERGLCRYAVFDADRANGLDVLLGLSWHLMSEGIASCLEASRRGGHLWVVLDGGYLASHVRRWLLPFCPPDVEFYPKQDEGCCGYGSLIRLPLGVHQRSGRRYPFLVWSPEDGQLVPVAGSVGDTLHWLAMSERVAVPASVQATVVPVAHDAIATCTPPSLAPPVAVSTRAHSTMSIHDWCLTQDAVAVIGRYVPLDRRGLGCCPFGEHHRDGVDRHPSLRVYPPHSATGSCWYCYTAQAGGNLFDFLLRYYRLDARTLWHSICSGAVF
jgi:hypothetical protein